MSEGIAIGAPHFFGVPQEESVPEFSISAREVEGEIARYREALDCSKRDLAALKSGFQKEGVEEGATILGAYLDILEDPWITIEMEEKIRETLRNIEALLSSEINRYRERFSTDTELFQSRLADVVDLSKTILGHLRETPPARPREGMLRNAILFAEELSPSRMMAISTTRVMALVTSQGGSSSHAALIARAKGIPYVSGIDTGAYTLAEVACVVVDGGAGLVILNPTDETLARYAQKAILARSRVRIPKRETTAPAFTRDGRQVVVRANIGSAEEMDLALRCGAAGIGLFRSEYPVLSHPALLLNEEEQYRIYQMALTKARGLMVTIRAFDLGGDKQISSGWNLGSSRGTALLLEQREMFRIQLRALLRASREGPLQILFPLIHSPQEMAAAQRLLFEEAATLGILSPPMGAMIELPEAALLASELILQSDFVSVGTNDLVPELLGSPRHALEGELHKIACHPRVLSTLQNIAEEALLQQKSVTLCGELASDSHFIPVLIGLGYTNLSCPPRAVPRVKEQLRKSEWAPLRHLVDQMLACSSTEAAYNHLSRFLQTTS